jgi:hypothetical protein
MTSDRRLTFAQPFRVMLFRRNYQHPCVNLSYQIIRLASDDRAGTNPFIASGGFRPSQRPAKDERGIILHLDRVPDFAGENLSSTRKSYPPELDIFAS